MNVFSIKGIEYFFKGTNENLWGLINFQNQGHKILDFESGLEKI